MGEPFKSERKKSKDKAEVGEEVCELENRFIKSKGRKV